MAELIKTDKAKLKRKQFDNLDEESCIPIVSDLSKRKLTWDLFIVFLAILTSFSAPSEFVFKQLETTRWYNIMSYIIDCIFICDVVVNFRTTFINHEGQEVKDLKKIAKRYMQGMFIFDLLSSIPIPNAVANRVGKWIKYFKLLKIVRIKKLTSVIQRLEFKED